MTEHRADPASQAYGPIPRDVVLRREGASVTLAQVPGLPQLVYRSFAEGVRVASAFAAAHGVDVWCAVGPHWSLLATHRLHLGAQQMPAGPVPGRSGPPYAGPLRPTVTSRV